MDTVEFIMAQAGPPAGGLQGLLPLLLILAVFYFLLVRPQQQRAKEHQKLVDGLKKNDRVVTNGGLHGRVIEVRDDEVVLEIAPNVQVRYDRAQIGALADAKKKEG